MLDDMWLTGTAIFFWVVLGVNLTLLRRLRVIMPLVVVVTVVCVLSFPVGVLVLDYVGSSLFHDYSLNGTFNIMFGVMSRRFVLASILVMVVFLMIGEPLIMNSESIASSRVSAGRAMERSGRGHGCRRASAEV